jgi:O-antigen/teichoic acid export membrane protein
MVWLGILIALPISFLAGFIVPLLFGVEYAPGIQVLSIHIWCVIFFNLGQAAQKWVLAENIAIYALYRQLLGGVVNIILNTILISRYGINGAAIATIISYAISSYFFYGFTKKTNITFKMQTRSLLFPLYLFKKRI